MAMKEPNPDLGPWPRPAAEALDTAERLLREKLGREPTSTELMEAWSKQFEESNRAWQDFEIAKGRRFVAGNYDPYGDDPGEFWRLGHWEYYDKKEGVWKRE